MKRLAFSILFLSCIGFWSAISLGDANPNNQCLSCHTETESPDGPAHQFERDVHSQNGLTCADCHGGDPKLDDMDAVRKAPGFRGVPDRLDIPAFCARCHSDPNYMHKHNPSLPVDQLEKYKTSIHGIQLLTHKDRKVATCVSCHRAHSIGDAKSPFSSTYAMNVPKTCGTCHSDKEYMKEYNIPTDQEEQYRVSVHGMALLEKQDQSAPACNDCHGNHGAAPPDVTSLSAVCGSCHAIEGRLYESSPHKKAFEDQGLPMCETCHGNHGIEKPSDAFIGFGTDQICGACHSASDANAASVEIDSLSLILANLGAATDSARQELQEAGKREMMTTDEEFALKEVEQIGIKSRSLVHAFTLDSLRTLIAEGIGKAKAVKDKSSGLVEEYYFRRRGLGISLSIIAVLALLLYLKIRSLDRKKS